MKINLYKDRIPNMFTRFYENIRKSKLIHTVELNFFFCSYFSSKKLNKIKNVRKRPEKFVRKFDMYNNKSNVIDFDRRTVYSVYKRVIPLNRNTNR